MNKKINKEVNLWKQISSITLYLREWIPY
jgi:hypothetical protein